MVTMTSADNALKSVYLGAVSEQLDTAINPLLAKIQRSTADVWGKEVRRLAQYGVNGGVGAGTEEGDLPSAAGNNYEQFVTTLKNLYGTIEISDKAVRASENNVGAFVNLLNAEMDGLIRSSAFNFGRMLFGDGSGVLCKVVSVSGNTVTADGVKNLIEGMVVDVLAAGGAPISGAKGRRVVAVDRAAKTFTLSGDALTGVAKDNFVCVQGSYNLELTGLGAIFKDTGSLYGLDRATHKWMIPYMQSSVGTLSETVMQKAIDWLEERAGSRVDFIVCSWGVKRSAAKPLVRKQALDRRGSARGRVQGDDLQRHSRGRGPFLSRRHHVPSQYLRFLPASSYATGSGWKGTTEKCSNRSRANRSIRRRWSSTPTSSARAPADRRCSQASRRRDLYGRREKRYESERDTLRRRRHAGARGTRLRFCRTAWARTCGRWKGRFPPFSAPTT